MYHEYHEEHQHGIGVAYYGSEDVRWSHTTLAELFGRKVINGILEGRRESYLAYYARLAGSYARLVIEEREAQDARNRAYREELARGFEAIHAAFGPRQEIEDRRLTEWLGGRQARLTEAMEE